MRVARAARNNLCTTTELARMRARDRERARATRPRNPAYNAVILTWAALQLEVQPQSTAEHSDTYAKMAGANDDVSLVPRLYCCSQDSDSHYEKEMAAIEAQIVLELQRIRHTVTEM